MTHDMDPTAGTNPDAVADRDLDSEALSDELDVDTEAPLDEADPTHPDSERVEPQVEESQADA